MRPSDINKIRREAFADAVKYAIVIFLTVLLDKEGADAEILQRVGREINELFESVTQGYCDLNDLKKVLRDEYGVKI